MHGRAYELFYWQTRRQTPRSTYLLKKNDRCPAELSLPCRLPGASCVPWLDDVDDDDDDVESVGVKEKRGKNPEDNSKQADRRKSFSSIDNSSLLFALLFSLSLPFMFLSPPLLPFHVPTIYGATIFLWSCYFLSARNRIVPVQTCQWHPCGLPRAQPSLGVPRGQTSSQKLRYVGQSTAAHPEHPSIPGNACVAFKPTPKPIPTWLAACCLSSFSLAFVVYPPLILTLCIIQYQQSCKQGFSVNFSRYILEIRQNHFWCL